MNGFSGFGNSPAKQKSIGETQVIDGVLCDAYGRPIDPKKKWEANINQNYKGPGGRNDSDKVMRGLGPGFKNSPTKQKEIDKDDQSKEAAKKRGELCLKCENRKGDCTCPKDTIGEGFMNPPYKDTASGKRPYAKRQGYHGYKNFKRMEGHGSKNK